MSDNLFVIVLILICLSTCGEPDFWDKAPLIVNVRDCEK